MKKILICFRIAYYILVPALYLGILYAVFTFMRFIILGKTVIGVMLFVAFALFVLTPIYTAVVMRFSTLRWYVDPFAALEVPAALYLAGVLDKIINGESVSHAFASVSDSFTNGGGKGTLLLIAIFAFGLLCSFSFKRREGKSISFRLAQRLANRKSK